MQDPQTSSPGEIAADRLYSIRELCGRMGWSAAAFRAARRAGLPVKYVGRSGFVYGQAVIDFVMATGKSSR